MQTRTELLKIRRNNLGRALPVGLSGRINNLFFMTKKPKKDNQKNDEGRYKKIFKHAGDAVFVADSEENIVTDCNQKALELTGFSKKELIGTNVADLHPKGIQKETLDKFKKQARGEAGIIETKIITKKGKEIPVSISSARIENNEKTELVGIFRDVSEKKATEKKFQLIFDSVGDALFILDLNGNFLEVNKAACQRLGYTKDELLSMGAKDIDAPEHAAQLKDKIQELQEKGEAIMETAHLTKKGKRIPIELSNKIIEYNDKVAILSVARDVSSGRELKWAKKRTKAMFNLIPNAIFTVNKDRKVTAWNQAAEKITGFKAEEIIGNDCTKFAHEPCNKHCSLLDEKTEKPIFGKECSIKTKTGEILTINKNVDTLEDDEGKTIGGVESFEDISKRKKMEDNLEEKLDELERMNKLMVDREKKMIELKEKIKRLENKK
ncbi:MAG: PAS domain S-box protein [Candidatus Moranbacteria bacterium]|nr:PAS domain S-box protein [Candidatus Moranbacteria bacterium]